MVVRLLWLDYIILQVFVCVYSPTSAYIIAFIGKEGVSLKFCELVQFMHHNYEVKANAGEFVAILIDAILDDAALEKDSSNPIYDLKKS